VLNEAVLAVDLDLFGGWIQVTNATGKVESNLAENV